MRENSLTGEAPATEPDELDFCKDIVIDIGLNATSRAIDRIASLQWSQYAPSTGQPNGQLNWMCGLLADTVDESSTVADETSRL